MLPHFCASFHLDLVLMGIDTEPGDQSNLRGRVTHRYIEGDDVCSFNQGSIFNYCSLVSPGPCQPQESGGVRFVMIYSNS